MWISPVVADSPVLAEVPLLLTSSVVADSPVAVVICLVLVEFLTGVDLCECDPPSFSGRWFVSARMESISGACRLHCKWHAHGGERSSKRRCFRKSRYHAGVLFAVAVEVLQL